jgi:hypothetical protein
MMRFRTAASPQSILAWVLAWLAASQIGLGLFLARVRPEVREPEYGSLLRTLRARLRENPGRPLVLILGSSRSANLFHAAPPAGPSEPVVFNFATLASGPVRQLQMLRRLLAEGVRPRGVVVELWTPFLNQRPGLAEEEFIRDRDLQLADGPLLARYFTNPWPSYRKLAEGLLLPAFGHRAKLLANFAPFPVRSEAGVPGNWADPPLRAADAFGWLAALAPRPRPEEFQHSLAHAAEYLHTRLADFRIRPVADRAVRELLRTCARHDARAILALLPEHSAVSAYIPAEVKARVDAYLADLAREEQATVIDARDWVSDDDFVDGVHTIGQAAAPFTERFRREVLSPLLAGRRVPAARCLPGPPAQSVQHPEEIP